MKIITYLLTLFILLLIISPASQAGESYIKFTIDNKSQLPQLTGLMSIDKVTSDSAQILTVYAYLNDQQLNYFKNKSLTYQLLTPPGQLINPTMANTTASITAWDVYPTYEQYDSLMNSFAVDYPTICRLDTIGYSTDGRLLLAVKLSDDVTVNENEPEMLYSSSMHGDELTGYVLMLRLIDSMLTSYGSDPNITYLIDNMEIWINPLANPDGTYQLDNSTVFNATRGNANSIDLNRNFPDPEDGPNPDGNDYQIETIAMMNFAASHNFILSANFHGGTEVINYPWDTWSRLHPDDAFLESISRDYADSAQFYSPPGYMTQLNNGITNGYAWYTISGGRQDYMTYFHNAREVTIEISSIKLIDPALLPEHWDYNKAALFHYIKQATNGINGQITDNDTALPLKAKINILNHDSEADQSFVFSDSTTGQYHRMLLFGIYDIEFSAEGYLPDTIFNIVIPGDTAITLDIALNCSGNGCEYICGDIDGTAQLDIDDIVGAVNYMFGFPSGPPPVRIETLDVNADGFNDMDDLIAMIEYMFGDGTPLNCL